MPPVQMMLFAACSRRGVLTLDHVRFGGPTRRLLVECDSGLFEIVAQQRVARSRR